jgi:hypothetical protein
VKELDQHILDRIDDYLVHRMSHADRMQFEEDMKNDPELANTFHELQEIHHAIGYNQAEQALKHAHQKMHVVSTSRRRIIPGILLAIAASAALLIALFFLLSRSQSEQAKLYAEYFSMDPGLPTTMDANKNEYTFYQGMVEYKSGDYQSAITRWEGLKGGDRYVDTLSFYLGMAHLGLDQLHQAESYFNESGSSDPFKDKRAWYSALIALRAGDVASARVTLQSLASRPGDFQKQAEALLQRIDT